MVINRLIIASALAVVIVDGGELFAQAAFPAPLPGRAETPTAIAPVPHVATAATPAFPGIPSSGVTDACMNGFLPLREEAEQRSRLIRAASERKAPPDEACKLIDDFGQAEIKLIKYIQANGARCGIPPEISEQFKKSHSDTERLQKQVCTMAQRHTSAGPDKVLGPGDFWIDR